MNWWDTPRCSRIPDFNIRRTQHSRYHIGSHPGSAELGIKPGLYAMVASPYQVAHRCTDVARLS